MNDKTFLSDKKFVIVIAMLYTLPRIHTLHTANQQKSKLKKATHAHRSQVCENVIDIFIIEFLVFCIVPLFWVWMGNCPGILFHSNAFNLKNVDIYEQYQTIDCHFNLKVSSRNWNALHNKIWWEYLSDVGYE